MEEREVGAVAVEEGGASLLALRRLSWPKRTSHYNNDAKRAECYSIIFNLWPDAFLPHENRCSTYRIPSPAEVTLFNEIMPVTLSKIC